MARHKIDDPATASEFMSWAKRFGSPGTQKNKKNDEEEAVQDSPRVTQKEPEVTNEDTWNSQQSTPNGEVIQVSQSCLTLMADH